MGKLFQFRPKRALSKRLQHKKRETWGYAGLVKNFELIDLAKHQYLTRLLQKLESRFHHQLETIHLPRAKADSREYQKLHQLLEDVSSELRAVRSNPTVSRVAQLFFIMHQAHLANDREHEEWVKELRRIARHP